MKKLSFILILLLATNVAFAVQDSKEVKVEKTFISVSGMTCMGCRGSVEKALRKAVGVTKAEVSLKKRWLMLNLTPRKPHYPNWKMQY
jgi:hypothetical protein